MNSSLQSHQISSTGRKVAFQVKQLGFESVSAFAASLPKTATVVGVGAGLSRLGHEVASIRPDIHWFNIDPCYNDEGIATEVEKARRI